MKVRVICTGVLWGGLVAMALPVVATTPAPAVATPASNKQVVKAEDVLIQGKLYSPSALFILTRPTETFERDAVVPHYLDATPVAQLAGSQLRPAVLQAHTKPKER